MRKQDSYIPGQLVYVVKSRWPHGEARNHYRARVVSRDDTFYHVRQLDEPQAFRVIPASDISGSFHASEPVDQ